MVWLLFSFEGRINRAKFYLAGLVLLCCMLSLLFLFIVVSAAYGDFRSFGLDAGFASLHVTLDGTNSFHLGIRDVFALVDPAAWRALPTTDIAGALAHVVVTPLLLWAFLIYTIGSLGKAAFRKESNPSGPAAFISYSKDVARIFVVVVIIAAAVALRYVDKLDAGILSILSSVAGYLLGSGIIQICHRQ